jgi:hypothetical protein
MHELTRIKISVISIIRGKKKINMRNMSYS